MSTKVWQVNDIIAQAVVMIILIAYEEYSVYHEPLYAWLLSSIRKLSAYKIWHYYGHVFSPCPVFHSGEINTGVLAYHRQTSAEIG